MWMPTCSASYQEQDDRGDWAGAIAYDSACVDLVAIQAKVSLLSVLSCAPRQKNAKPLSGCMLPAAAGDATTSHAAQSEDACGCAS